jgi:hypothetical protein
MMWRSLYAFAASLLLLACGAAPRAVLSPPVLPLASHAPLPPEPQPATSDHQASTLEVARVTLPCGLDLAVLPRPGALAGAIALRAEGSWQGDGSPIEDELVLVETLERVLGAQVELDERGLFLGVLATADDTRTRAVQLAELVAHPRLASHDVARATSIVAETRRAYHARGDLLFPARFAQRLYGPGSARALALDTTRAFHEPPALRIEQRLARLMRPERVTLVVVGPVDPAEVERAVAEATSALPPQPHAAPRPLASPEPRAHRP